MEDSEARKLISCLGVSRRRAKRLQLWSALHSIDVALLFVLGDSLQSKPHTSRRESKQVICLDPLLQADSSPHGLGLREVSVQTGEELLLQPLYHIITKSDDAPGTIQFDLYDLDAGTTIDLDDPNFAPRSQTQPPGTKRKDGVTEASVQRLSPSSLTKQQRREIRVRQLETWQFGSGGCEVKSLAEQ
eukprot:Skav220605  [mRNA]  locus=scaffold507:89339:90057:+ [translate_table: standard]